MRRPRRPARDLRSAIDHMPAQTRRAMLDALDLGPIIVGAYADRDGGVCPMLAAHRNGGRTSFAGFARAWDRYTSAADRPRPVSERELRALRAMLEASLSLEPPTAVEAGLGTAIAAHRRAQTGRARREEHELPRDHEDRLRPPGLEPLDLDTMDLQTETDLDHLRPPGLEALDGGTEARPPGGRQVALR